MTKIRTTIRPLEEIEVDDRELADLKAQGLVLNSNAASDAGLMKAAEEQSTASVPVDEATATVADAGNKEK